MATNYQMDPVLRRIDAAERRQAAADGFAVETAIGTGWFPEKRHYAVTLPRGRAGRATFLFNRDVDAPERNWHLPLQVSVTVEFAGESVTDAQKLVDLLRDAPNPDRGMEALFNQWIDKHLDEQKLSPLGFIQQFGAVLESLKAKLVARARQEGCLQVTSVDIRPRSATDSAVMEISIPNMLVVLKDYQPDVSLEFHADLRIVEGSVLPYLSGRNRDLLEQELRQKVRDLCRTQVGLHAWQMDPVRVKTLIAGIVDQVAADAGRKIDRIVVQARPVIQGIQASLEANLTEEQFRQLDYPDPVQVSVALRLDLVDLGAFVASGIPPSGLEDWLRRMTRDAIVHHLIDVYYVDLFDKYDDKKKSTEDAIRNAALRIGYQLNRCRIHTNLDFDVISRGFDCRIEKASFPLALRECEVSLDIEALLRITDRKTLRNLFLKDQGIKQTIESRIRSAVAAELRDTSPSDFYLKFGDGGPDSTSVVVRLEEAIRKECADFNPDPGFRIQFARRSDELSSTFESLMRTPIELNGLEESNTEIVVDVHATVDRIFDEHFSRFQMTKPTPERVASSVRNHVLSFIGECARRNLKSLLAASSADVERAAEGWINDRLAAEVGVGVHISHWRRHDSLFSAPVRSVDEAIRAMEAALSEVMKQKGNAIVQGEPADVLRDFDTRIAAVKATLRELYEERGTGSVMTPVEPEFLIGAPPEPKRIASKSSQPSEE